MSDNRELKEIQLNNVNVDMRQSQYGKDYFIIFDNDTSDAYFCFRSVDNLNHEDFERLKENWGQITRIQLTYFETEWQGRTNKKVVNFKLPTQ